MSIYDQYETVIGLEVHVQLSTQSKAFCADSTAFGAAPNTQVSAISLGHPGTLPRINRQQVQYALRLGMALQSDIQLRHSFDRKNYFYADLPKGYQITQDRAPFCRGGQMTLKMDGYTRTVRIHHVHMEEDAGKSIHDQDPYYSLIDLNRAGVPLLEIVTQPDLRSPEEVDVFMTAMRQLVRYLEVSDGNMEEGSLRCDCNVSVRKKGSEKLGERCEIKNLNSMRFARRAIEFEVKRQIDLLEAGGKVEQQTLHFDPVSGETSPLRSKEDAHDYRYFPEPDLPPILHTPAELDAIRSKMPPLPWELLAHFTQTIGLPEYDAALLTEEKSIALFYKDLIALTPLHKPAANLVINKIKPWLQENNRTAAQFPLPGKHLAEMLQLIEEGKVSNSVAYQQLFPAMLDQPGTTPLELAQVLGILQSSNTDELAGWIEEVLTTNPGKVAEYRKGKKGLIGFFMGEIMKKSRGKADPKKTQQLLADVLDTK